MPIHTWVMPHVGDGATIQLWSDRHAATVVEVSQGGRVMRLQRDIETRIDHNELSENQTYEFARDPNGELLRVRWTDDKGWRVMGSGYPVHLGHRNAYRDPSF